MDFEGANHACGLAPGRMERLIWWDQHRNLVFDYFSLRVVLKSEARSALSLDCAACETKNGYPTSPRARFTFVCRLTHHHAEAFKSHAIACETHAFWMKLGYAFDVPVLRES